VPAPTARAMIAAVTLDQLLIGSPGSRRTQNSAAVFATRRPCDRFSQALSVNLCDGNILASLAPSNCQPNGLKPLWDFGLRASVLVWRHSHNLPSNSGLSREPITLSIPCTCRPLGRSLLCRLFAGD
jgi:hypothetical protein